MKTFMPFTPAGKEAHQHVFIVETTVKAKISVK